MAKQLIAKFPAAAVLVLLLICCAVLVKASNIDNDEVDDPAKNPWFGHKLPAEPRKNYYKFLKQCTEDLTQRCGLQVYDFIFNARDDIDESCCKRFIGIGEKCDIALSYTLSHIQDFARWRGHIYNKARAVRDFCAKKI